MNGNLVVCAEAVIGQEAFREGRIPLKQIRKQLVGKINQAILDTVLARSGGNKSEASRVLDLDYKTVYALCRKTANKKESAHEQTEKPRPGERGI
jgi:DNA-binding NtrC family response regulator